MTTMPSTTATVSRRRFLAHTAAGGAGLLVLPAGSARGYAANDRLNIALIGVHGYCAWHAFAQAMHVYDNASIVALCDVDQRKVAPAYELWDARAKGWPTSDQPQERQAAGAYERLAKSPPPLFADFRRMFDEMDRDIDAVVVATPDHTHAVAAAAALRAGKHVLSEKPLTLTVKESRGLRELAVRQKCATSVGTQGMQYPGFRRGLELIRQGTIGAVREVHVWFNREGRDLQQPPHGAPPVPAELNWDLWLGPVAWRAYHPDWIARTHWRDTSAGGLGNFGPHTANLAFMALNVVDLWQADASAAGATIRVEAQCPQTNHLSFPRWERIKWQVPARGELPPVTFNWHHGPDDASGARELIPRLMRDHGASDADIAALFQYAGAMLIGDKGALCTDSHNTKVALLPNDRFADVPTDRPRTVTPSRGHYHDWMRACRGGDAPWGRYEYAGPFNEFLMLGDVATRFPGEAMRYDPAAGRVLNHAEADQALSYEYREGWRL